MMKKLSLVCITLFLFNCANSQEINLDDHGVSVTLDDYWNYSKLSDDTYVLKYECEENTLFCKNIVIRVIENTDQKILEQVTQSIIEALPTKHKSYKVIGVAEGTIEGNKYKVLDYIMKENDIHLGSTTVVIRRDNDLLLFHLAGLNQPEGNFRKERDSFFNILEGVKMEYKNVR